MGCDTLYCTAYSTDKIIHFGFSLLWFIITQTVHRDEKQFFSNVLFKEGIMIWLVTLACIETWYATFIFLINPVILGC